MNLQHERILRIIADLAGDNQSEVDEFSVAEACGAIPTNLPRHAWVNHPCRGELLRVLTGLDQGRLIYLNKRGYWGIYLTQRGQQLIAERNTIPAIPEQQADHVITPTAELMPQPIAPEPVWEGPRPAMLPISPRHDHFYSTLTLAIAALGAILIFAFGQNVFSPVSHEAGAASNPVIASPSLPPKLPIAITATAVPPTPVTVKTYLVANTGGDGVFLRKAPQDGAKLAAWPDNTPLIEAGPDQTINSTTWRHVRAPDGSEGYVPAQYTTLKP